MLTAKVETITKEIAQEYITKINGNRPLSDQHIRDLMARQKRGEWQVNGDTLVFDENGDLRDGQHRLHMIARTGIAVETVVVRGISPDAFLTMDAGRRRTLGDALGIQRQPHYKDLGECLPWVTRYLSGKMTPGGIYRSHEQHLKVLDLHPEMHDSVALYLAIERPQGAPRYHPITMAMHYLFSRVDKVEANDFIERLVTGLRLDDPNDPVARLRGQLVAYASEKRKPLPTGGQIFGLFTTAWNAKRRGAPILQSMKLRERRSVERPRLDGFPKELFLNAQLSFTEVAEEEPENNEE